MFAGYYIADVLSPLQSLLENQLGWNAKEYGFVTSAYGWFNVFLLFLIIGGIILDKMGARFTGVTAALVMVVGAGLKYWAISTDVLDGVTLFGWKGQVMVAALGFATFGVGVEVAGITVSKIIVKWFTGHEMALAMGIQISVARLGTGLAIATALPVGKYFADASKPILFGVLLLLIGLLAFIVYTFNDKKLDKSLAADKALNNDTSVEEEFRIKDILKIVTNKAWWYIATLCVLFYSAVFPFLKYATNLMINKFSVPDDWAGAIPSLLPFGTILLTPLFGGIYDKKGKGATIMIIGAVIITLVHTVFSLPMLDNYLLAIVLVLLLGVGFSLVPSAMWPSVPKIIPEKQLGTAFSLIFWVQNWGLMGVPYLIGWVLNKYCITSAPGAEITTYDYTIPMMIFTGFGILAIIVGFLLKLEDKKKGYGLELPNIKK
jgi:MFS family permease